MKIVRPKELAELLSISVPTLYRMINKGELPPKIQISSRAVGWRERDIENWLQEKSEICELDSISES